MPSVKARKVQVVCISQTKYAILIHKNPCFVLPIAVSKRTLTGASVLNQFHMNVIDDRAVGYSGMCGSELIV